MDTIHNLLQEHITGLIAEGKVSDDQIQEVVDETIQGVLPEISEVLLGSLKRRAPKMLKERRGLTSGFRRRHLKRWRRAFDLLEMLYVICEEAGAEFNAETRPKSVEDKDQVFEAVVTLHARALLVANEILCLLKGGFADGALSHWRTLHEIAVIAQFLSEHDCDIAERYLMSFHVQAYRAMCQYQEYSEKAGLVPYSESEMEDAQRARDEVIGHHGPSMKHDYGWASGPLRNAKPTLRDIEHSLNLDHWRPWYRWASHYTHANYKPPATLLGLTEASEPLLLVGPSDSGMTDPAHMMAISLFHTTTALILLEPNFDRLVIVSLLTSLLDEVGEVFWRTERDSLERYRARQTAPPPHPSMA